MVSKTAIPLFRFSDPKNYRLALDQARRNLAAGEPEQMAAQSGCPFDPVLSVFYVTLLDHPFTVSFPAGSVKYQDTDLEPYFVLQIIMINYLSRADGTPLSYNFVPYRSLDGGAVYADAFFKTAVWPLTQAFGSCPELLVLAAAPYGGIPYPQGTGTGVLLYLLPRVPLLYKIWPGEEEFPAQANILFDATANHYLHTEDLAACDVVTRLMVNQLKRLKKEQ